MQMQPEELQQLQERLAQLEQENAALQAEVADLRQREVALQAQATAAQDRATALATLNAALQAELLLQQQTETALRESECRFRNAFEQAVMGMTITDLEGHWVHINPYAYNMLGYTEAEMWAFTCADLTDPDTLVDDHASVQRLISGELPAYQTEKRYLCKNGSRLWASLTTSLVRDVAGNPAYLISIVQDISQRKEAESIAQGQQRALQNTLALLSTEPELDKFLGQVLATIVEQLQASVVDIWLEDADHTVTTLHLSHWNVQLAPEPLVAFNPPPIPLSALTIMAREIEDHNQPFV